MQKFLAIKLGVIVAIALLLLVPLAMIDNKIGERRGFEAQARQNIARSWTGRQTVMPPVLVQTYRVRAERQTGVTQSGTPIRETVTESRSRYLIPETVSLTVEAVTERRRQGLYQIPVYTNSIEMQGSFGRERIEEFLAGLEAETGLVDADNPYLLLSVADMRGIAGSPALSWETQSLELQPASGALMSGIRATLPPMPMESNGEFSVALALRGMEHFHIIPAGKDMRVDMIADWPHPKFSGAFLPQTYATSNTGFEASWRLNHFSTGIEQRLEHCRFGNCNLSDAAFGVDLIQAVDKYLQAERSLKYGILFVGLSFVGFFIFEVLRNIAIHPLQYALVGFALAVFFLLLVSLSEHLAFGIAYLIAAAACIALLAYYVRYVLGGWRETGAFAGGLATLYGVLFIIVRAEDFALLMGSVLIFAVLAGVMILTRNIDWYTVGQQRSELLAPNH